MAKVDDFSKLILKALQENVDEIDAISKKEINKLAKDVKKSLETNPNIPERFGNYKKSFKVKKIADGEGYRRMAVYSDKHYRLTHLLEFGHVIFTGTTKGQTQKHTKGGRTRAFPHWADAQKVAEELPKRIKEAIENR